MQHKILIAEDDTDINRLLSRILEAQGYQALQAFSGTEALSLIEREEPDLLLLDLMLPGLSGEELLRKLREERRYSFPVLILSAKSALGENNIFRDFTHHIYLRPLEHQASRRLNLPVTV